jgi:hypothetical protein
VQGAGWLTTEELVWDDDGRLRTHAPSTYKIPACSDRPDIFNVALWDGREPRGDDLSLQGRGRAALHAGHLGPSGAVGRGGGLRATPIPRSMRPRRRNRVARRSEAARWALTSMPCAGPWRPTAPSRGWWSPTPGSSPREVGAAMLVWAAGNRGTIGGGALEWEATPPAPLARRAARASRHALGPDLGQCCGGAVTLLTEDWDDAAVAGLTGEVVARKASGDGPPLAVRRLIARARGQGVAPAPALIDGWMIEPRHRASRDVWIWGAGHVGRALVGYWRRCPTWR